MIKQVILVVIVAVVTACSYDAETVNAQPQHNQIEKINEFVIPDTFDIKKELVLAAYYEIHPKKACVIFAYNDTSRTTVKKYSYSSDSSFAVKDLLNISYNDFKVKDDTTERYTIKPKSVVWMRIGNSPMSAEYERIDVAK